MDSLDAQFTSLAFYITDTGPVYRHAVLNNLNLEMATDKAITVFDYKKLLYNAFHSAIIECNSYVFGSSNEHTLFLLFLGYPVHYANRYHIVSPA